MQKTFRHKTHNINKKWRNGCTDRLMQAEHTFCLTALNKRGLRRMRKQERPWKQVGKKVEKRGKKQEYPRWKLLPISNQFNFHKGGFYPIMTEI